MDPEAKRVHFRNQSLLNLVKDRQVFPHMQDLILRGSDKILSSRWNGLQTLEILLQYAVKLCIYLKPGSLRATLKPLQSMASSDCRRSSGCREFLELLFSSAPQLRQIFEVPKLHLVSDASVKKNEVVQSFIHFLIESLQVLLVSEQDPNFPEQDQLGLVLMELKFLLMFLGDTPLQGSGLEENNNILTDVETIANEAGDFLFSFLFTANPVDVALSVLLQKLGILKTKIKAFFTKLSNLPKGIARNTALVSSFIVDSFLDDLNHLIKNKDDIIVDVKDQFTTFHKELMLTRSFLKGIDVRFHSEKKIKDSVTQFSNLAYEAEYIIKLFVVGEVPIWYLAIRLTDFIQKNKLISNALMNIGEVTESPPAKSLKPETIPPAVDIMVGFEKEHDAILRELTGGPEWRQIISIIGMPGLGKTTLANKLYDHSSVLSHFDKHCWIYVSQTYQKRNILFDILRSISSLDQSTMNNMDDHKLTNHVHQSLKGTRYLIVMDDIWNVSAWDDFKRYFPDDNIGSRILFTSREKVVTLERDPVFHTLPLLTDDECWSLLEQKVFKNDVCLPELQHLGKEIAKNCAGLPFAVTVIASVLANMEQDESLWKKVASGLSNYIFEGASKDILELSYEHLPIHLRPCFLYFGAFGNSKEVSVRKLQSLWIAEGFVGKDEHRTLEDIAKEYLADLINRSLVQISKRKSDGGVRTCNLHDLIRDMCLRIAEKETFLKVIHTDFSIYERHRRLSVTYCKDKTCTIPCGFHIHSLLSYHFQAPPLSLRNLKLARVLEFYRVLEGIEFLVHLRYLAISNLSLLTVSLKNLEYLLAEHGRVIPPFIMRMPKLKHLNVAQTIRFSEHCDISNK